MYYKIKNISSINDDNGLKIVIQLKLETGEEARMTIDIDNYINTSVEKTNNTKTYNFEIKLRDEDGHYGSIDLFPKKDNQNKEEKSPRSPIVNVEDIIKCIDNDIDFYNNVVRKDNTLRDNIVKTANFCLGIPYKWGGQDLDGVDCSGLIYYIFKTNGILLPSNSQKQYDMCTLVPRSELKEGDLVFFLGGNMNVPNHVGLYIGNNKFIHAPKTGDVVKISDLDSRDDFLAGGKILI